MFVLPWRGMNIIPQIGHMIMTLNIGWVVLTTFRMSDYKTAVIGLLLGIVIFSIFIGFQQNYVATHLEDFKRIMNIGKIK
jgi:hypothetical protein